MNLRHLCITAGIGAALVLSACGGGKERSYAQVREGLIKDCIGAKPQDKALCTCTADELKKKGYDTAKKLDKINNETKAGKKPPDVLAAIATCSK
jgi:hypothetical protein